MIIDLEKDSKYQEQIIEYKFASELMISLGYKGKKLELLRVHTDAFGYDLILKVDDEIKYVQLKGNKDTEKYCKVSKKNLVQLSSIDDLAKVLFL